MRVALPVTCNRPDTSELQRGISREDVCTEPVYTAHTSPVLSNRAAPKKGAQSTPGVCLLWFIQYSVKPGTEIETVQGAAPGPASASPGGPDRSSLPTLKKTLWRLSYQLRLLSYSL